MKTPKSPTIRTKANPRHGEPANTDEVQRSKLLTWSTWAEALGIKANEGLLVALSGGADSVLLLRTLAEAEPRPPIFALHFDHGMRGAESRADAEFCRQLCSELGIPIRVIEAAINTNEPGIEARARKARYRALCSEASRLSIDTIVTGHHADDRLETFLQRFIRGDVLSGLSGPQSRLNLAPGSHLNPTTTNLCIARPMLGLRRVQIRTALQKSGFECREDSSNADQSFTRNRIRRGLLPVVAQLGGPEAIDNLHKLEQAARANEASIDERIADLAWTSPRFALARGNPSSQSFLIARDDLLRLPRTLRRRALWRLLEAKTDQGPNRRLLNQLLDELEAATLVRHQIAGGWFLHLRAHHVVLTGPKTGDTTPKHAAEPSLQLKVPGSLVLSDGRRITAQIIVENSAANIPRGSNEVDLEATSIASVLQVRFPQPGDRLTPLGAPGSRRLCRFLADSGIARDERESVPLVFNESELIWVAGIRPTENRRIRKSNDRRLRLRLDFVENCAE